MIKLCMNRAKSANERTVILKKLCWIFCEDTDSFFGKPYIQWTAEVYDIWHKNSVTPDQKRDKINQFKIRFASDRMSCSTDSNKTEKVKA